jgi:hypothetical protein
LADFVYTTRIPPQKVLNGIFRGRRPVGRPQLREEDNILVTDEWMEKTSRG